MAVPCNTAIYLLCEQGRWLRDEFIYQHRLAKGLPTGPRPILPMAIEASANAAEYACKYSTKFDNVEVLNGAMNHIEEMERSGKIEREGGAHVEMDTRVGVTKLTQANNQITRSTIYPSVALLSYVLGHGDSFMSHSVAFLNMFMFRNLLAPQVIVDGSESACYITSILLSPPGNADKRVCMNAVVDYLNRPAVLKQFSPYFYTMFFCKVLKDDIFTRQQSSDDSTTNRRQSHRYHLGPDHPEVRTHMIKQRPRPKLIHMPCKLPMRPTLDDVDLESKEVYARFALSIFSTTLQDKPVVSASGEVCHHTRFDDEDQEDLADMLDQGFAGQVNEGDLARADVRRYSTITNSEASTSQHAVPDENDASQALELAVDSCTPYWDRMLRWESQGGNYTGYAIRILGNIDSHAQTQHRSTQAAAIKRDELTAAIEASGCVNTSTGPFDDEPSNKNGYDDSDSDFELDPTENNLSALAEFDDSIVHAEAVGKPLSYAVAAARPVQDAVQQLRSDRSFPLNPSHHSVYRDPNPDTAADRFDMTKAAAKTAMLGFRRDQVRLQPEKSPSVERTLRIIHGCPARIMIIDNTDPAKPVETAHPLGVEPPYLRMLPVPSIGDAIAAFSLAPDQAFPFAVLAEKFEEMKTYYNHKPCQGPKPDRPAQLLACITGEPGTGKTQSLHTFLWYVFQHGLSDKVKVTAYTWRAAQQASTPSHQGVSTCRLFGVNPMRGSAAELTGSALKISTQVQNNLCDAWFVFMDEISLCSLEHLSVISQSATDALFATHQCLDKDAIFGGLNVIACGDPYQHEPPGGSSIFRGMRHVELQAGIQAGTATLPKKVLQRPVPLPKSGKACNGQRIWHQFTTGFHLTTQHRFDPQDKDAAILQGHVRTLMTLPCPPEETAEAKNIFATVEHERLLKITDLSDALQRSTITDFKSFLANNSPVHALVLRHTVRIQISRQLALAHANFLREPVIEWRAVDTLLDADREKHVLNFAEKTHLQAAFRALGNVQDVGGLPPTDMFFKGQEMLFQSNLNPAIGYYTNALGIEEKIILDPREPDATEEQIALGHRFLKYLPLGIHIRPYGIDIGALSPNVTPGCFLVRYKIKSLF